MVQIIEKVNDISHEEKELFISSGYVCIDTETTGLDYMSGELCTIQLFCDKYCVIIRYNNKFEYLNLKELLYSQEVLKIFHNAVFDVSFLMKNLNMNYFGKIACTKIASKIVNGLGHNNSLKSLLKEYLNVDIDKSEQLSDWSQKILSDKQKQYAVNDVKYLYCLWQKLKKELVDKSLDEVATNCFGFIPYYKKVTDLGIENIFKY